MRTMRVNVIGTYNALEAALATLGTVERFIDFSTSEVFGTQAFRVTEGEVRSIGSVGEARWTYAVSKLAGEHMAHAYHAELGLPTVTVHPFNVYGPGQIGGGAIRAFIEGALAGHDLTIHGDGSQIRAWCYIDDMVEALLLCLERPEAVGHAFNVGNPRSAATIYDLAQRVKRLTGCSGEIVFQPLHYADVELRIPDVEKAREVLGLAGARRARRGPRAHDRLVPGAARRAGGVSDEIRLARPDVGEAELAAMAEVLADGQLTMGPRVAAFERAVAAAVGTADAVAVSSGTAALHLALLALGVGDGDEVVVPAYTFPATANVVRLCGARPVLVDVDPDTFLVRPELVAGAVTGRTRAVIGVHLFGRPARLGGAPDGRAAGGGPARGRRRRARRPVPGRAVRLARARRLPLLPPAQDRHHR